MTSKNCLAIMLAGLPLIVGCASQEGESRDSTESAITASSASDALAQLVANEPYVGEMRMGTTGEVRPILFHVTSSGPDTGATELHICHPRFASCDDAPSIGFAFQISGEGNDWGLITQTTDGPRRYRIGSRDGMPTIDLGTDAISPLIPRQIAR